MTAHEAATELRALLSTLPRRHAPEYPPRTRAGMVVMWSRTPTGILAGEPLENQPAAVQESIAELVDAILDAADNAGKES